MIRFTGLKLIFADKRFRFFALPIGILTAIGLAISTLVNKSVDNSIDVQYPTIKVSTAQSSPKRDLNQFYEGAYRILSAWTFSPDAPSVSQLIKNGDLLDLPPAPDSGRWALSNGKTVELRGVSRKFCEHFNHGNPPKQPSEANGTSGCYRDLNQQLIVYYRESEPVLPSSQYQILTGEVETKEGVQRLRVKRHSQIYDVCPNDAKDPGRSFYLHEPEEFRICVPASEKGSVSEVLAVLYAGDRFQESFKDSVRQVIVGVFL